MSNVFHLDIVTPASTVYSSEVISLVVPAELGYMGILANHTALVAHIVKGKIIIRDKDNQAKIINTEGNGFMEVLKNKATLILESAMEKKEGT
ncbi:MAG: hypothetical protein PHU91_01910 [Candidatus Omnitrophica bacterium]|nr:hypothetical protein [Candidatus Omnitrophota bacterium]MDD5236411.1 hypothetical protein [Candidatus Omnitrophota bacterium]MDD5610649.1 hypothetical protein [Candidatus Omnitrophota bacterium]